MPEAAPRAALPGQIRPGPSRGTGFVAGALAGMLLVASAAAAGEVVDVVGNGRDEFSGDGGPAKQARLSGPKGIAVGPDGDIYLADTESHTIRVIRTESGTIETLVGDGTRGDGPPGDPRRCRLDRPHGVFVDAAGNVYIGDSSNHRVRKLVVHR